MIASSATAVLPVCRSPMISWRWPRPMAVMASTALMPVCSGSLTGWRCDDGRRLQLEDAAALGDDLALAVDRVAERVDDAAEEAVADRHREDVAGAADRLALLDAGRVAEDDGADLAGVEVEREAEHAALELEQLVGHRGVQALDAGDAVADLGDGADLLAGGLGAVRRDVLLDRRPDVLRADAELRHLRVPALWSRGGARAGGVGWVGLSRRGGGGRPRGCAARCRRGPRRRRAPRCRRGRRGRRRPAAATCRP